MGKASSICSIHKPHHYRWFWQFQHRVWFASRPFRWYRMRYQKHWMQSTCRRHQFLTWLCSLDSRPYRLSQNQVCFWVGAKWRVHHSSKWWFHRKYHLLKIVGNQIIINNWSPIVWVSMFYWKSPSWHHNSCSIHHCFDLEQNTRPYSHHLGVDL